MDWQSISWRVSSDFFYGYDEIWDFFRGYDEIFYDGNGYFWGVCAHSIPQLRWKSQDEISGVTVEKPHFSL